ncbi:MAG: NAD(P)H-hydrate dehydratase [Candidatus Marsarchaeota archaeon]|jgi:NAD(P)H-hydrate epimerase|nr:NAD(P)H-hydrate dehydratase [Candidatus Marsarchaeota archaeon]
MQSLKAFSKYTNSRLTSNLSKAIDLNAFSFGISESQMMESAGYSVAEFIKDINKNNKKVFVFCGIGGNGGDGMVCARHLSKYFNTCVILIGNEEQIKNKSTLLNYKILKNMKSIIFESVDEALKKINKSDIIIVDAIFGVGFHGYLDKNITDIIFQINKLSSELNRMVIAVDVPSGIDISDKRAANAINADYTITFYKNKEFLSESGHAGKIIVRNIGIPIDVELLTGEGDIFLATKEKSIDSNKYTNGGVLIIGGSTIYHGAPISAAISANNALAALRTSVGYATLFLPESIIDTARHFSKDLIIHSFKNKLNNNDIIKVNEIKHNVTVIGPGLDTDKKSLGVISKILKNEGLKGNKIIIDASAIHAYKLLLKSKSYLKNIVITPHLGEFQSLLGINIKDNDINKKIDLAINFARKTNTTLVLKGHETIITDGKLLKINIAKTPALATMGSGDVLNGIIAAYLANGVDPFRSSVAAVYLHSIIGDILFKKKGMHIVANDIIDMIPEILKKYDIVKKVEN